MSETQAKQPTPEQVAVMLMRACYDAANRIANHCSDGAARWAMRDLYDAANEAKKHISATAAPDPDKADEAPKPAFACSALVSRLDWTFEAESRRWLGRLRGHPDRTLFILNLVEGRDDRCHLLGGVMSDSEDRQHTRALVTWAKMAAEWYLNDFEALLKTANCVSQTSGSLIEPPTKGTP